MSAVFGLFLGFFVALPAKFFQGFLFFLASVRDVLFYFFKFFKKLKKNKIEYADLRSKCSRIYSDTKLTAKRYHLEVVLISEKMN